MKLSPIDASKVVQYRADDVGFVHAIATDGTLTLSENAAAELDCVPVRRATEPEILYRAKHVKGLGRGADWDADSHADCADSCADEILLYDVADATCGGAPRTKADLEPYARDDHQFAYPSIVTGISAGDKLVADTSALSLGRGGEGAISA